MKRNYIIPTTESMAFHAGFICQTASSASDSNVTVTGPVIGTGGGQELGNPD